MFDRDTIMQLHRNIIQILASGIEVSKQLVHQDIHATSTFNHCTSKDTWLTDNHIEMLRLILDNQKMKIPKGCDIELPSTTIVLNTHFFTKFEIDQKEALLWLRGNFNRHDLLFDHGLLAESLIVPINLSNTHWILGVISLKENYYTAINPFQPKQPSDEELQKIHAIADAIKNEFGLASFKRGLPCFLSRLPIQHKKDSINCGVYVSMYMVIYAFGLNSHYFIGELLPSNIEQCRFLLLSWLLKGEVFFPRHPF